MSADVEREERTKWVRECPVCGHEDAALDYKLAWTTNEVEPFLNCFSADCRGLGGRYIEEAGVALGLPPGSTKEDVARAWARAVEGEEQDSGSRGSRSSGGVSHSLGLPDEQPAPRSGPERLPSDETVRGWAERLLAGGGGALAYLREERGLTLATIRRYRLGVASRWFGGEQRFSITMPVYAAGELVSVRWRFWPREPDAPVGKYEYVATRTVKIVGSAGRPAALYPEVQPGDALLLVEGEFDALLARQKGFPAVTSTAGTSWAREWDPVLRGRRVAVVYDAGSEELARRRASGLAAGREGAAEAWAVDLSSAGLADGEDLTDWFVKHGRTVADLRRLIKDSKEVGS